MKKMLAIAALTLFAVMALPSQEVTAQTKPIFTTLDLKEDYEVISVLTFQVSVESELFGDPLDKAFQRL